MKLTCAACSMHIVPAQGKFKLTRGHDVWAVTVWDWLPYHLGVAEALRWPRASQLAAAQDRTRPSPGGRAGTRDTGPRLILNYFFMFYDLPRERYQGLPDLWEVVQPNNGDYIGRLERCTHTQARNEMSC